MRDSIRLMVIGILVLAAGILLTYWGCGGEVRIGFPLVTCR